MIIEADAQVEAPSHLSRTPVVYVLCVTHFQRARCGLLPEERHDMSDDEAHTELSDVLGVFTRREAAEQAARRSTTYSIHWGEGCRSDENEGMLWRGWAGPPKDPNHWLYEIEPWHLDSLPALRTEFDTER